MDAQMVIAALSGVLTIPVGIAIGRQMNVRRDLQALSKKLHDIQDWRTATVPKEYVNKEALGLILKPLTDALARVEQQQGAMAAEIKDITKWVNQHGASV